jgi:histidinol phosphatase-like PHP family hydrolase
MIDLHTHSLFSDGELIPSELIRRAEEIGYKAIAITDHVDASNLDIAIPRVLKAINAIRNHISIIAIPGAEITHVPPAIIPEMVKEARKLGARIVVVHGETIVEPVAPGTNRAAIEGGADILAHPGIISSDDMLFAKEKGILLEITARKGHSLSNGHVAKEALKHDIPLCINTDTHSPSDLITRQTAARILRAAGIDEIYIDAIFDNSKKLVDRILGRN